MGLMDFEYISFGNVLLRSPQKAPQRWSIQKFDNDEQSKTDDRIHEQESNFKHATHRVDILEFNSRSRPLFLIHAVFGVLGFQVLPE
jgi:hypothetical protein